jgi:TonB family protein
MNNRKPLVVGIAIALIVGLAIGAVSFYLLRPAARSDGLMSTASTTVPPVTGTASASTTTAPPTTQDAAPNAALPPAFTCFDLSKQEPHSLEGKLRSTVFADEPDYADVRHGDDPVEGYLLQLDSNICIQGDESADPTIQIAEVQVYPKDWDLRIEAAMRSLIGFRVRLTLAGGQSAMTGHDHRPLVAQVSDIVLLDPNAAGTVIPRTMLPRTTWTDIASTTVLAFYEALSLGNGEVASSLVVAEKRSSGPYAPENINRFYGPLPEPLRLTELKAQGPNEYLARYTYGTSSRRCRGSSIVTTTQRDGLTFIDRIRELEGCAALSSSDHLSVANSNRPIPHGPNNGQDRVTRTIAPTPSATIASAHTNIRQDPQHPLKIGEDYYPDASKRANEEGRCVVKLTVAANGRIVDQSIQESSGFPRLDEACVSAVRGQRMLPATENGRPVETTVAIPIVWKLNN